MQNPLKDYASAIQSNYLLSLGTGVRVPVGVLQTGQGSWHLARPLAYFVLPPAPFGSCHGDVAAAVAQSHRLLKPFRLSSLHFEWLLSVSRRRFATPSDGHPWRAVVEAALIVSGRPGISEFISIRLVQVAAIRGYLCKRGSSTLRLNLHRVRSARDLPIVVGPR